MYNYSSLFKGEDENEAINEPSAPKFSDRWQWFSIIERLACGDITKFEEVYKVPYITALNTLSFWHEKEQYQERLRRRQEMMSKHK